MARLAVQSLVARRRLMALASDLIKRGYRRSNLIPLVGAPNAAQTVEGLEHFNGVMLSAVGSVAGAELRDLNVGGSFDMSQYATDWVPDCARLVLNLDGARTLKLDPCPYEGQRVAIVDPKGNLSGSPLTLDGNGRKIEGVAALVLNVDGLDRQWIYRADKGEWVRISALAEGDTFPFPVEFEDYFVTMLAVRLNPQYGQAMPESVSFALRDAEGRFSARYRRPRPVQETGSLGLLGQGTSAIGGSVNDFMAGRARW